MPSVGELCGIFCGACRIGCYTLCCKIICRKKGHTPRPSFRVICLGLGGAGKSTALSSLIGNEEPVQRTIGFNIVAVPFEKCILNIKELGGSDQVRQYWERYLQETPDALLLCVDGSASDDQLLLAARELRDACELPALRGLPVHMLITHTDSAGARPKQQVLDLLDAASWLSASYSWSCAACNARDVSQTREAMRALTRALLPPQDEQTPLNKRGGFSSI